MPLVRSPAGVIAARGLDDVVGGEGGPLRGGRGRGAGEEDGGEDEAGRHESIIARGPRWTAGRADGENARVEPAADAMARPLRDGVLRTVRLVGEPEAMDWVARTLAGSGLLVERHDEKDVHDPKFFHHWPVVWVTRPDAFGRGFALARPPLLDIAKAPPPCLVVVPPGVEITDPLVRRIPLESFEVVRERDEGPLLAMRLERLLLLHRRRSASEENAFRERLRVEAKRNEILASIALAARDSLDLERDPRLGDRAPRHALQRELRRDLVPERRRRVLHASSWTGGPATSRRRSSDTSGRCPRASRSAPS